MASLDSTLRSVLEKAIIAARDEAEDAARAALDVLAVTQQRAFETLTSEQRALRNALRSKARHLGSGSQSNGFALLVEEVAYVQWHRMLFPLFLAKNDLLIHTTGVAVTIEECEELVTEEGDPDRWATAARYAGSMLPGIFPSDDPSGQVTFAPEGRAALEAILSTLPSPVFTSDDGLGWVYQFWQSKKKREVSGSGRKIEKFDLAAYSQLFTEDYMVRFLLENSLGAWWAARHPDSPLIKGFKYLRFRKDGTPAAGTFTGWPEQTGDVTVMDPCCGSGHFLVVAFEMLRQMRMEEEGLDEISASDAVIRDNLYGLELDPRCVQIAAFNLALTAWKVSGYRELPTLNVACSGIPIWGQLETWTRLAGKDANMRQTLDRLHRLFVNAPDLGSLIDPANVPIKYRMFTPEFERVSPLLKDALSKETAGDPVTAVFGSAALGVARAAELMAHQYTLVATNVPYLARGKQGDVLKDFIELHHGEAKVDLATAFVQRCRAFTEPGGSHALVTPQNWMFLVTYQALRHQLLTSEEWNLVALLGMAAFSDMNWWAFNTALTVITDKPSPENHTFFGVDASARKGPFEKERLLKESTIFSIEQRLQLCNPDYRVSLLTDTTGELLEKYAHSFQGIATADYARFGRCFWEFPDISGRWEFQQSTVKTTRAYGGREHIFLWELGTGTLARSPQARVQGLAALHKQGVAVSQMNRLPATLYRGDYFDNNTAVIVPNDLSHLEAIWAYCSSEEFYSNVRNIDGAVKVTNATLLKVPFDLERWKSIVEELWSGGLPEPYSDDPTQWLFQGNPSDSTDPLHVAVARLLGYQWPQQNSDELSDLGISDVILPLASVAGQDPASEKLRRVLSTGYRGRWSIGRQTELLRQVGFETKSLSAWLRDGFFQQHCKLFHQRPFIWHIWDGRKDGFSALVNYHKLDAANLDRLIYTYLGEWIRTQRVAEDSGTPGANARLVASLDLQKKLKAIRYGEPPYDIYVRWKPLHKQPIGWNPDLNDGVRLNIRPFVTAGVLRSRVNVNWKKDRGRNSDGSERFNDVHLTLAQKRAAREAKAE